MITRLIRCPTEEDLRLAGVTVRAGGLVAFPTETVYGLGASALDRRAAARVYTAKGRPSDNPLIVHLPRADLAGQIARVSSTFDALARAFLPGPLTVILPKKEVIPDEVTGGLPTVALRVPEHPLAREFLAQCDVPVAAPSANTSGHPSPTAADHVLHDLGGKIEMILDGGSCRCGVESTIVKVEEDALLLLRPGAITPKMITAATGLPVLDRTWVVVAPGETPLAPGMKYRHYAPRARVILLRGNREAILAFLRARAGDPTVAILSDGEDMATIAPDRTISLGDRTDPVSMAHRLFAALRALDDREEITTAYAAMPPEEGVGEAVANRLRKAAGNQILDVK